MRTLFLVFLACSLLAATAGAVTIQGIVTDQSTGKPVEDATVTLSTVTFGATTDSDGRFAFLRVPDDKPFMLSVSHVSYRAATIHVIRPSAEPIYIELKPKAYRAARVTITVDRVEGKTATVPFTNVTKDELDLRYFAQDLPVALEGIPSLTTTTDAGNALGYSYLSMRGFDFKRVSVLLNGVMLNDPEDFYVYWVDLADFGANVQDVQVQRGAGSALLGLPAVGGTIDVQTTGFSDQPAVTAEYGVGSYATRRGSAHLQSGPIQEKYFLDARFSRITSDGYREQAWADYFSYYLSGARVDKNMTTRLVLFGGPIKNHMAYYGISRDQAAMDRTFNPLTYKDETDNYYQPHYQLHNTWEINSHLRLQNTLFYIRGEGHFNVYYPSDWYYSWDFWDLPELTTTDPNQYPEAWYRYDENGNLVISPDGRYYVDYTDAVARQHVDNNQGGWQPRLTWRIGNHTVDAGGQYISHRSRRYGELIWAAALPEGADPNHVWYDYQGRKQIISGYLQDRWQLSAKLNLNAAVQLAHVQYQVLHDKRFGNEFTRPYTFFMPRTGFSYHLSESARIFSSYSRITREPRLKDHYWAETGYPVIRYPNGDFTQDPQIKPETLDDFELGVEWSDQNTFASITGYLMNVENEIVDIGQYDVLGQPVIENAAKTRRLGVEVAARRVFAAGLFAEGNFTLSSNRFVDYRTDVQLYDAISGTVIPVRMDLSEYQIINAPEQLANIALGIRNPRYEMQLSAHFVGERYVANTDNFGGDLAFPANAAYTTLRQDRSLDACTRVDLNANFRLLAPEGSAGLFRYKQLPLVELALHVRNLLDTEYYLTGSADAYDVYVIPAATRNYFAELKLTM